MTALNKLQRAFAADLRGDGLHNLQGLIVEDHLPAARRLNVYRNNFQTSLTDALAAIYPVVERLVGREFFGFMADRYIRSRPSRSGNLNNLGAAMAEFLGGFQAVSQLPYLPDVARLEWAYHTVFHAAAPPSFELNALQKFAAEIYPILRFDLSEACRLVCSTYPIFSIWQVNQEDHAGDMEVNLDVGPESVLIVRPELEVELWRLNPAENALLVALESGNDLGDAVDAGLKISPNFDLQSALVRYLSSGVLRVAS